MPMKSSLLKRIIGSVLLVVVFIGALLAHPLLYAILFSLGMAVMMDELYHMTMGRGVHTLERVLMTGLCCAVFLCFIIFRLYGVSYRYLLLALPILMLILSATLFDSHREPDCLQKLCFPAVYLLPSFMTGSLLLFAGDGSYSPALFIAVMVLVWMSDVGGYALGITFGQRQGARKLCPSISPNKSWAGVVGSILFTLAAAVAIHCSGLFSLQLWHWAVMSVIVVFFGITGDLFESLIKRQYGYKDAGKIIVGHGGLLDRFDGALFSVPVATVFLILTDIVQLNL